MNAIKSLSDILQRVMLAWSLSALLSFYISELKDVSNEMETHGTATKLYVYVYVYWVVCQAHHEYHYCHRPITKTSISNDKLKLKPRKKHSQVRSRNRFHNISEVNPYFESLCMRWAELLSKTNTKGAPLFHGRYALILFKRFFPSQMAWLGRLHGLLCSVEVPLYFLTDYKKFTDLFQSYSLVSWRNVILFWSTGGCSELSNE